MAVYSLRIDTRVYTDLARAEYFIVIYIETDGRHWHFNLIQKPGVSMRFACKIQNLRVSTRPV